MKTDTYKAVLEQLEKQLDASAFRRGVSAFRYGALPQGPSDHLPVELKVSLFSGDEMLQAVSWNLLSDDHLYNNFLNVSGIESILQSLSKESQKSNIYGGTASRNRLFYFLSELAEFLYQHRTGPQLVITPELLQNFVEAEPKSALLKTKSTDSDALKLLKASRAELISLLTDETHALAHEFKLAIQHSVELIHHILSEGGVLKWHNRLKLIMNNPELLASLRSADVLCFQECTDPADIAQILGEERMEAMTLLSHKTREKSRDNCVLVFNKRKFTLHDEPYKGAIDGKKPYLFAKLQDEQSGERFIVGSIHHPGGGHDKTAEYMDVIASLLEHPQMPYLVLGDFNTPDGVFQPKEKGCRFIYPKNRGTLAGGDFSNTNKAIDALMTNISSEAVQIATSHFLQPAPLVERGLIVSFKASHKDQMRPVLFSKPSYNKRVAISHQASEVVSEMLPRNYDAKIGRCVIL